MKTFRHKLIVCALIITLIFWFKAINKNKMHIFSEQNKMLHTNMQVEPHIAQNNNFLNDRNNSTTFRTIHYLDGFNNSKYSNKLRDMDYLQGFKNSNDIGYLQFIRQNWIYNPSADRRFDFSKLNEDQSEVDQAKYVAELLGFKRNGIFVESGAGDGWLYSNTLYLEMTLGWTGVLIDPNIKIVTEPKTYKRNAFKCNVCLSNEPYSKSNVSYIDNGYWSKVKPAKYVPNRKMKTNFTTVQCFPLQAILNSISIKHVDYLSLDIEGGELNVLQTISFEELTINVIGVEYRVTIGTPEAPFIDFEATAEKLMHLRQFFKLTALYNEVGILPKFKSNMKYQEEYGLEIFFNRKNLVYN